MTAKPHQPLLLNVAWAAVLLLGVAVLYVLSYAPVVKATGRGNQFLYRPCLRLYTDSPASRPLTGWASLWGEDVQFFILIAALEALPKGGVGIE